MAQHRDINHTGLTGVSTVSYASNANQTSTANYGGAATTVSRGDHIHLSTGGSGDVATDAIWDAAGDLAQGTGANTAAKLTAGTAGNFLKSAGAAAANVWAFPPGHQFDYVEFTSNVSVTATVEASADTIVAGTSQTYAAGDYWVEFFSHQVTPNPTAGAYLILSLWDGATELGDIGITQNATGATTVPIGGPQVCKRKVTLTAATHQLIIKGHTSGGQPANVQAGAGGVATRLPGYILVTKA